jgi:hypothetical protein
MKIASKAKFSLLLTVAMLTSCNSFLPTLNTQPTQAVKTATSIERTTITETQTAIPTKTSTPTLLPLATPLPPINSHPTPLPTASLANTSEFIEPDSETFVSLYPALLEYFYYRKQAVIRGDVQELWANFPELQNDKNIQQVTCLNFCVHLE